MISRLLLTVGLDSVWTIPITSSVVKYLDSDSESTNSTERCDCYDTLIRSQTIHPLGDHLADEQAGLSTTLDQLISNCLIDDLTAIPAEQLVRLLTSLLKSYSNRYFGLKSIKAEHQDLTAIGRLRFTPDRDELVR